MQTHGCMTLNIQLIYKDITVFISNMWACDVFKWLPKEEN